MKSTELQGIKQRYNIVGNCDALNHVLDVALQVAPTDLSVLIIGESGVGKEIIPRVIHDNSPRRREKYFAINCGSIPEGTMRDMTTFSFAVPIKPKCVYKPYNGKLGDYLTVYLEMHDSRHREESFQNRMKMYYSRLKELNL